MASSIYYPRNLCTPLDIANQFCPPGNTPEEFQQRFLSANHFLTAKSQCPPSRPVMVPGAHQDSSLNLGPLNACTAEEQRTLAELGRYAGGSAVLGTAKLMADLRLNEIAGNMLSYGGGGISAASALSDKVLSAIHYYDTVNSEYQKLKNHRAAPSTLRSFEKVVERAFTKMNQELHARSLDYLNNQTFGMRQATTVTGRQVWESIPVADSLDVQRLSRFAKAARIAGPGMLVLDGGLRTHNVYQAHQTGDPNWKRMAVVEGGSFAAGIGMGVLIGAAIAFTPVGLAIGIFVGGAVAVASDHLFKRFFNFIYDLVRS